MEGWIWSHDFQLSSPVLHRRSIFGVESVWRVSETQALTWKKIIESDRNALQANAATPSGMILVGGKMKLEANKERVVDRFELELPDDIILVLRHPQRMDDASCNEDPCHRRHTPHIPDLSLSLSLFIAHQSKCHQRHGHQQQAPATSNFSK